MARNDVFAFGCLLLGTLFSLSSLNSVHGTSTGDIDNIFQFNASLNGSEVSFKKYTGDVLLVVNVASECTLTEANYKQLNELHSRYSSQGLRIIGFPSNQFYQEPGDAATIRKFLNDKKVQFDVYDKIDVNGDNAHPVYKWLKSKLKGILFTEAIKWNFTKFLLDSYGHPVKRYGPMHEPKDIEEDIKTELKKRAEMLKLLANDNSTERSREL